MRLAIYYRNLYACISLIIVLNLNSKNLLIQMYNYNDTFSHENDAFKPNEK